MAPTALALFGIDKPDYMEGEPVFDPAALDRGAAGAAA